MKLNHHGPQDYQSLLMHQEAVRMIQCDPSLAYKALEIIFSLLKDINYLSHNLHQAARRLLLTKVIR